MEEVAALDAVSSPACGEDEELELTPPRIVAELDKYVISQDEAKRAVAIALRNRWRRLRVKGEMRDEITPKNIIMIGPTGVGKTEIARRLAKLTRAPFVKVEATKFTEVGYVGRDVDSIIRDLVESAFQLIKEQEKARVLKRAEEIAEERLLDYLLPGSGIEGVQAAPPESEDPEQSGNLVFLQDPEGVGHAAQDSSSSRTREKLRAQLRAGKLENRIIEIEVTRQVSTQMQILGPQGFSEIEGQIKEMFANMIPKQKDTKKVGVVDARKVLIQEAQESLLDPDKLAQLALRRAEESGIVFIDEIDKICGGQGGGGRSPDVSREGVQRDLLPLVEGCTISTRYGVVRTDHVLFIASGAFHISKPSDLMPEFQGRFPIRVELRSLTPQDFVRILTEPKNALTRQYQALLASENVELDFRQDAIEELAQLTAEVNSSTENIGARRLHTLLEKLLEDVSFDAENRRGATIIINREYVRDRLRNIVEDRDLSRFVL